MNNLPRTLYLFLAALLLLVGLPVRATSAAPGTPEQVLREFYGWYVPAADRGEDLLETKRAELRRYVSAGFLKRIDRLRQVSGGLEADPFLEAQDFDAEWGKRISVRDVAIHGETATAEIALSSKRTSTQRLHVSLLREDGAWKLDRVEVRK